MHKNLASESHASQAPARGELVVGISRDIHDVPEAEWDSIVPEGAIQRSHAFVRACQESGVEEALYWHLMIRRDGELIATASLSRMTVSLELLSSRALRRAAESIRRRRASFMRLPVLFCGLPVSFGQPCIAFRDKADLPQVIPIIVETMERIAVQHSADLLCWKEFDDEMADALMGLVDAGYFRARSLPSCSMALPWDDFDSYCSSLRSTYRRQIAASLEERERAGLRVRVVVDFANEVPALFSLYEQVIDRAQHRLERLNPSFFSALNGNLGSDSRAIIVDLDSQPVAAAVVLTSGPSAVYLLAGIDYARSRFCQGYPNLVTEVVREAIRSGAVHLEMGQTSYEIKSRLGAAESPRWVFLRHRTKWVHMLLHAASGALFPATRYPVRRVFRDE